MSENKPQNYYLMRRGWHKNEVFKDKSFCDRMAWSWLIENAAFDDREFFINDEKVNLSRGQLAVTYGYLAVIFGWSKSKVMRTAKRYSDRTMIVTQSEPKFTIITICNYSDYQFSQDVSEPTKGRKRNAKRTKVDIQSKELLKNDINNYLNNDTNLVTCDFSFDEFYLAYPVKKSKVVAEKKFNQVCKDKQTFDVIMNGLSEFKRWIKETGQHPKYVKHPSTWLNQECWKDELIFSKPPPEPKKPTDNLGGFDKYINGHDNPEPDFESMKDITQ